MKDTRKVILNTGFMYTKMIISIIIALYATRIVLNALGANDFGIYSLVAGVIAMLSFLNAAMTISTQRYLSIFLGKNDPTSLNQVLKASVILHLVIGVSVVIILEIAGLFLFNGVLNIHEDRIVSAKIVYQFMIVSTFFTINAVPFDASIVAHEKLHFEAIVGITDFVFRLIIAFTITWFAYDKLVLYGGLMALLIILVRIVKSVYCWKNFAEFKTYKGIQVEYSLMKEMFAFGGWNMFGALCGLGRNQGIAIILNIFFGTVVNAAYGIAYQVNAQLMALSTNMLKALNPQIFKSEGGGMRLQMLDLSLLASKYGYFLVLLFSVPLIIEMPYVLKLWLKDVPNFTIIFCRLVLIVSLINQLTVGSFSALQATGRIKIYQPVAGTILLLNIPLSYFLLKFGYPPYSVLISMIAIEIVSLFSKLYFWVHTAGLKLSQFLKQVVKPTFLVSIISISSISLLLNFVHVNNPFISLLSTCTAWVVFFFTAMYFWGIEKGIRDKIRSLIFKT